MTKRQIRAIIASVGLDPRDWDVDEVTRHANSWVEDKLAELGPEDDWSQEDIAAAYEEHGRFAAVDFFELVWENPAHEDAPDLFENGFGLRVLGPTRFDAWPPIWIARVSP